MLEGIKPAIGTDLACRILREVERALGWVPSWSTSALVAQ